MGTHTILAYAGIDAIYIKQCDAYDIFVLSFFTLALWVEFTSLLISALANRRLNKILMAQPKAPLI
jgi:hypothetical protein